MRMNGPAVAGALGTLAATVLGVGLWAAAARNRKKAPPPANRQNDLILANRSVGLFLGVFSLVATYVGHTFVNGTADAVFSKGLAWCQVPVGYGLSLLFGALLFAKPMRRAEYVTMLDPFQQRYGARLGGLLMFVPALCGDLFWCAALLRALGASLNYVAGIEMSLGVSLTALLVALYVVAGGLYSAVWTDALQLLFIAVGLAVAAPYAVLHPSVSFEKSLMSGDWLGEIRNEDLGEWIDTMLLAIFGGIPWQGYFQRILSIKNPSFSRTMSIASMFGCLALAVPLTMIGIIARATDRSLIESYNNNWRDNGNSIIPLVLRYLTPQWVSLAGLGAISAGVMASADSSILGISSMFSRNVYKLSMRPKASERELDWVLRISVAIVSSVCAAIALSVSSVYYLAYLCSDLVYVILFPQLLSVIHWPSLVDSYGCIAGYLVAVVIRISGGEKSLGIPVFVEYPYYDVRTHTQKFPFRSLAMLGSILVQLIVSFFTRNLLGEGFFPRCCDVLDVYAPGNLQSKNGANGGVVQSTSGAALIDCAMNDASPGHMSDMSTDYDASSTDTQLQAPIHQQQRYDTISVVYDSKMTPQAPGSAAHKANQTLQGLHNLREAMSQTATVAGRPGQLGSQHHHSTMIGSPVAPGQILGVKNLNLTPGHMGECLVPQRIMSPTTPSMGTPYAKVPTTIITNGRLEGGDKVGGDRSNMELNLNLTDGSGIVKKNIKGVKLIGMEGGTLRRPSLQGTFSPTPSVEMVNIFDRRQSSGSFGPSSLSPIPGVEACKTHGTAAAGGHGNEHCRIKRGIVRHHSFNDTGDRTLTTLGRQATYPSMPLRNDGMTTLQRKDHNGSLMQRKSCGQINRHSEACLRPPEQDTISHMTTLRRDKCRSVAGHHNISRYSSSYAEDRSGLIGHLLVSPTYSMYNSRNCSYFVADDEAVSRF